MYTLKNKRCFERFFTARITIFDSTKNQSWVWEALVCFYSLHSIQQEQQHWGWSQRATRAALPWEKPVQPSSTGTGGVQPSALCVCADHWHTTSHFCISEDKGFTCSNPQCEKCSCEFAKSLQSYTIVVQCHLFYEKQEAFVSLFLLVCFCCTRGCSGSPVCSLIFHQVIERTGGKEQSAFYGSSLEPAYDCSQFPQIVLLLVKAQCLSHFEGKAED